MEPRPCVGCRTLVEPSGIGSYGQALVHESRMTPNEHMIAPPLCWDCRGVVLLNPPEMEEFLLPDGSMAHIGIGCTHHATSEHHLPILRFLPPTG